jgi:hypothetical protein
MKKLLMLTILIAGFGLSQARPPGERAKVHPTFQMDNSQFNVVQDCSILFNVVPDGTMLTNVVHLDYEFSNYLTYELSAEITTPIENCNYGTMCYGISAGGIAYANSKGTVNLLNHGWYVNQQGKEILKNPVLTNEVWLLNCNIKTSPPVA